jgi:hypothetical protein
VVQERLFRLFLIVPHRSAPVNHALPGCALPEHSLIVSGQGEGRFHTTKNPHRTSNRRNMGAQIVMLIHDALWVEAPEEEAAQVRHLARRMMETAGKPYLKVSLEVDLG